MNSWHLFWEYTMAATGLIFTATFTVLWIAACITEHRDKIARDRRYGRTR